MATIIASGAWWTLDDTGLLSIFCVGDMPDYVYTDDIPWKENRAAVKSISIADSVTSIGQYAFYLCANATSVTIPDSVTSIGADAFSSCAGLTSVTIPNSVTSIDNYAFDGCAGLTSVTIPDSVTSFGEAVFLDCLSLTNVSIGNGVTSIDNATFYNCTRLTSVTIPASVDSIGHSAFEGCESLTSVTIPASVAFIGDFAFDGCESLTDVYYAGTEAQWNEIGIGEEDNDPLTGATKHYNYYALTGVFVATPPTKTAYVAGETFDPAGMVVTATYIYASPATVADYSVSPSGALTTSDRVITVSYTEDDVTVTADVAITVRRAPDLKLIFNGVDFSSRLSTYRVTYETNYRKVVTALRGTEYFGDATRRPVITFTLFPMTDAQAKITYDALKIMVATCSYTDPAIVGSSYASASRTAKFRVTSSLEAAFGLRSVDGNRYYKGGEIVLRGVSCLA